MKFQRTSITWQNDCPHEGSKSKGHTKRLRSRTIRHNAKACLMHGIEPPSKYGYSGWSW